MSFSNYEMSDEIPIHLERRGIGEKLLSTLVFTLGRLTVDAVS